MVKKSVLRGFGGHVQKVISASTKNRFTAMLSGLGIAIFLQSSVAVAVLTSSFVGRGLMTTAAGIAIVLGADMGTAVVSRLLSFPMDWIAPFFLSLGIIMHLIWDEIGTKRYIARMIIGIAFIFMALGIIKETAGHLTASQTLPLILQPLESEVILAVLVSGLLTYFMHSSLSAVLLFAALAGSGILSLKLSLLFVIGANVGAGLIPLVAVMKDTPQALQIPLGNLLARGLTAIIAFSALPFADQAINSFPLLLGDDPTYHVIFAHIAFNLALVVVFLPFITPLANICIRLSPMKESEESLNLKPRYLDNKALSTPTIALSCATRETLHMTEVLEKILKESVKPFETHDKKLIEEIEAQDDLLDTLFLATKDYVIKLSREELNDQESRQAMHILNFATNIEHCGDIIEKSLMVMARKQMKSGDHFSNDGLMEIQLFQEQVLENLKLAQHIFLSSDDDLARQLVEGKKDLKIAENASAQSHMDRLRTGLPQSVATSSLHMDILRDYRRINTYISSVAYTILEEQRHENNNKAN